ncbi:MAG: hypothetical protein ACRDOK_12760 [Streptosporangiaceae bacterium]
MAGGKKAKKITVTGLALVDALAANEAPGMQDYISAVSEYVLTAKSLPRGGPKKAQIALGTGLGRVLAGELAARTPRMKLHSGERTVAGALRPARADVSESHDLDGLRLAVEIKPVNLAVGRALWNRFGDIRAFAVNIHLKFPFAVVGGILVIPTWEEVKLTKKMLAERSVAEAAFMRGTGIAEAPSAADEEAEQTGDEEDVDEEDEAEALGAAGEATYRKPTLELIERLIARLGKTRARETEADPAHLLEAVTVIVYDPDTATMRPDLPAPDSRVGQVRFDHGRYLRPALRLTLANPVMPLPLPGPPPGRRGRGRRLSQPISARADSMTSSRRCRPGIEMPAT